MVRRNEAKNIKKQSSLSHSEGLAKSQNPYNVDEEKIQKKNKILKMQIKQKQVNEIKRMIEKEELLIQMKDVRLVHNDSYLA